VQRRGKAPGPSSQPDRQSSEGTGRCCRGGHERRSARLPRGEAIAILGRDRVEARGGVRAYGLVETERYRFRVVAPSGDSGKRGCVMNRIPRRTRRRPNRPSTNEMPRKLGELYKDWEGSRVSVERYEVLVDSRG
jgi:hypothetical protein